MKTFVLVRGESGRLYLYNRETWLAVVNNTNNKNTLEFVVDNDDLKVLKQMQELVNKDIHIHSPLEE